MTEIHFLTGDAYKAAYTCPVREEQSHAGHRHEWNLFERTEVQHRKRADGVHEFTRRETWYCSRCRLIEERTSDA